MALKASLDHWTHANHEKERLDLIHRVQEFSAKRNIRVTFIAGDVHCGGVGRLFSASELADSRLTYQIVSSAIGNIPPPNSVICQLHRSAKVIKLDDVTYEEMLDLFHEDVDGKPLTEKKLIGRRNWCSVEPDSEKEGAIKFSLQVENEDYRQPSKAYSVSVPPLR